jgi:hypothetical protein
MVQTREQHRVSTRKHYSENRDRYLERNRQRILLYRGIICAAKSVPCMDCKESFPVVCMDFDHRNPEEKSFNISRLGMITSEKRLREEIAKCDVVCSNCHRIRTWG